MCCGGRGEGIPKVIRVGFLEEATCQLHVRVWGIFEGTKGVLFVSLANTNGARKWAGPEGVLDECSWPSKDLTTLQRWTVPFNVRDGVL